jgi:hypothetical protein
MEQVPWETEGTAQLRVVTTVVLSANQAIAVFSPRIIGKEVE